MRYFVSDKFLTFFVKSTVLKGMRTFPEAKYPKEFVKYNIKLIYNMVFIALSTPVSSALTVPNKRTQPEKAEATPPAKSALFSFQCPTTNGDAIKPMFGKPAEDKPAAPGGFSFNFASSTPAATSAVVAPTFTSPTTQTDSAKQAAPLFKFGARFVICYRFRYS